MSFTIVIPSRNWSNLRACILALRNAGETARVIVVWDGEYRAWADFRQIMADEYIEGVEPFCFARNANVGIRVAGTGDVLLLNDDALLGTRREFSDGTVWETPRAFTAMAKLLSWQQYANLGILSARIKGAAHPAHAANEDTRVLASVCFQPFLASVCFVPFVAVLIRRTLIDRIGLLDEQFAPGGYEDNDYCRRAIEAGFEVGVFSGCVVDHQTLPHTFRPQGKPQLYDLAANRKRYEDKWRGK